MRRRGIDVTTTPEENLIGKLDEEQLAFAISQKRIIFTQDTDFLRLQQQGVSHYGIAYCQQKSKSIGEIVQSLVLIWQVLEVDEMMNHLEYL